MLHRITMQVTGNNQGDTVLDPGFCSNWQQYTQPRKVNNHRYCFMSSRSKSKSFDVILSSLTAHNHGLARIRCPTQPSPVQITRTSSFLQNDTPPPSLPLSLGQSSPAFPTLLSPNPNRTRQKSSPNSRLLDRLRRVRELYPSFPASVLPAGTTRALRRRGLRCARGQNPSRLQIPIPRGGGGGRGPRRRWSPRRRARSGAPSPTPRSAPMAAR